MNFYSLLSIIEDLAINKNDIKVVNEDLGDFHSKISVFVDEYSYIFETDRNDNVIYFERL